MCQFFLFHAVSVFGRRKTVSCAGRPPFGSAQSQEVRILLAVRILLSKHDAPLERALRSHGCSVHGVRDAGLGPCRVHIAGSARRSDADQSRGRIFLHPRKLSSPTTPSGTRGDQRALPTGDVVPLLAGSGSLTFPSEQQYDPSNKHACHENCQVLICRIHKLVLESTSIVAAS